MANDHVTGEGALTVGRLAAALYAISGDCNCDEIAAQVWPLILADRQRVEGWSKELSDELVGMRRDLRRAFGQAGIPSNPGWSPSDFPWAVRQLQKRAEDAEARLATSERETVERAIKATCAHCRDEEHSKMYPVSRDRFGKLSHPRPDGTIWDLCSAAAIRALLGGK